MSIFQYVTQSKGKEVCLVGVKGKVHQNAEMLTNFPLYEGHAFYETEEKLLVGSVCINEDIVPITKICKCSLSHCSNLKDIYISKHVKTIEWNMYGCSRLQNIFVESDNNQYLDVEGVLYKKNQDIIEKIVGFPEGRIGSYTIMEGITEICNCTFKSSKLSQIHIPDSVEIIGANVFYLCKNLKEIVLPKNLKVFRLNCNPKLDGKLVPVSQRFYLFEDKNKLYPYNSFEISEMFHE